MKLSLLLLFVLLLFINKPITVQKFKSTRFLSYTIAYSTHWGINLADFDYNKSKMYSSQINKQETIRYQLKTKTHQYEVAGVYAVDNELAVDLSSQQFTIKYCQYSNRTEWNRKEGKQWLVQGNWREKKGCLALHVNYPEEMNGDIMIFKKVKGNLIRVPSYDFDYSGMKKEAKLPVWKKKK